jgi:DNA-binding response OmpR family regulator
MVNKILIVDDEISVARLYEEYLNENGFEVMCIDDPLVAVEAFSAFQPDLVLLDINMHEKNGFTVLREIKKISPSVPIYFLSAYDEYKRNFNSLYAEEFIPKSRDPKIIVKLINTIAETA